MLFSSKSHIGLARNENQDYLGHIKTKDGILFVVCDGVGGLPNGALASKIAVDNIINGFLSLDITSTSRLYDAMQLGQKAVMKANPKPLGTTVATCFIKNKTAYCGWCGDSRIYYFQNGDIAWMSVDHNILHDVLNKGTKKKSAFMNPRALNRFFGREFEVKSEYHSFLFNKGDKILICSDGLTNFLAETEIISAIIHNSAEEATQIMENRLLSKEIGAPDNFSWYIINI